MTKVIIKGRYKISFGDVISVTADEIIHVGDSVLGDDGAEYIVKQIIMPTTPENNQIGLVIWREGEI